MLKVALSAFVTILCMSAAQANDSAIARITVKGIDPGPMNEQNEIKFYGENADTFFQMLPGIKIAGTRTEQRKQNSKWRHVAVVSKGYTLSIACSKMTTDKDGNEVKSPNGTECSISVAKGQQEDGDSFELKAPVCK